MHRNAVPTVFIHKIFVTAHGNVLLSSNCGDKVIKIRKKTMAQICPWVFYFSWPSPHDWRTTLHCNVTLMIFHAWCPRTYTDFMVPGSESATYLFPIGLVSLEIIDKNIFARFRHRLKLFSDQVGITPSANRGTTFENIYFMLP